MLETPRKLLRFLQAQLAYPPRVRFSSIRRYPSFADLSEFLNHSRIHTAAAPRNIAIDLGSSTTPCNPLGAKLLYGVDIVTADNPSVLQCDFFREHIPFGDQTVSIVTAFDFIEHVPRVQVLENGTKFPFMSLIDDIWRILEPHGFFLQVSPAYPFKEVFQDPTHVNILTEETFPNYFCGYVSRLPWAHAYGYRGNFTLVAQG
jgi:hypothetical protein